MALPPSRTNLATNPDAEASATAATVRTNYFTNPRFAGNTAGVPALCTAYATGAPTGTRSVTGVIQTVGTTSIAAGARWGTSSTLTVPSSTNDVTVAIDYTITGAAGTVARLYVDAKDAGAVVQGNASVSGTGTGTLTVTISPSAAVVTVLVYWWIENTTGATIATPVTATFSRPRTEVHNLGGAYFDGATAAAGDFTFNWAGTVDASASQMKAIPPTGFSAIPGGTGAGFMRRSADAPASGSFCARMEWTRPGTTGSAGLIYTQTVSGSAGKVISVLARVRSSVQKTMVLLVRFRNVSTPVGAAQTPQYITIPANTTTEFRVENVIATGAYTNIQVYALILNSEVQNVGDTFDMDCVLIDDNAPALTGGYFGGTTAEGNWVSRWNGTANASTSTADYYGIWAEQVAGGGAPKVQVTAIGLGGVAADTQVTRQCGREIWSVPGWKKRNSLSADTYTDATPPLGRPVTYTLLKDGLTVNSMTITVESTTGWVQDPLSPGTAMPVATTDGNPSVLALAKASLKKATYGVTFEEETPLGGQYPIVRANQRSGASGVEFHLNAYSNVTSDALQQLVLDAPVLLFRGLPSWGSIPALAYLIGDVEEAPYNRDRGGQFTTWLAGGKLSAPVALGPIVGLITNQMVQDNLTGRTNASIQATTGSKRNIDVQANPLGLGQ